MPIHSAHRKHHREPFPAPPSPALYRNIAYTFVGVTVVIVVAALWVSSVRAVVTIRATRQPVTVNATVDVARVPGQGQLPGRVVQGVFEKIQEFTVSSSVGRSENSIATGKVRITNDYSKAQPLIKTTRLLTADGRLYRINDSVNVPAGGTVDVEAYADERGAQFEFTQKTKFTIPGLAVSLQKMIYAESVSPFAGGTQSVKILAQEDLDKAQKELEVSVLDQAKKTLFAEVADSAFTQTVYLVKTLETKSSVKPGEEAERFLMSLKLDVTGVFYPREDMEELVKSRLSERIPEGRDITSYDPAKTVFSVERVDVKNESASIGLTAEVQTKLGDKSPDLPKDLILGLSIDEAEQKLEVVEGIESASIIVKPSWVRRLPTLKDHVTFEVE